MTNEVEKQKFSWNPFVKIVDDRHALELAKGGGLACLALLAFSYALMILLVAFGGKSPYAGDSDAVSAQIGNGIALALAAFLAWRVWARQPLWALWAVLVWIIVETIGKIMLAAGGLHVQPWGFFINVIGVIAAVQAVRGGIQISRQRRTARRAAVEAGFDL